MVALFLVDDYVSAELRHWCFLDAWTGCMSWRSEAHKQIVLATDASSYKYGAVVLRGTDGIPPQTLCDYFGAVEKPIHLKEAEAVHNCLLSFESKLKHHRVDVLVDKQVVLHGLQLNIDTRKIEDRLSLLDKKTDQSNSAKRKRLAASLADFLSNLPTPLTLCSCSPEDIRKFLVWKDEFGKTKIHTASCLYIGSSDSRVNCACPLRLAAGTVEGVINLLCRIFEDHGFGRFWDSMTMQGYPVCSQIVKEYLTRIREEQAKANVLPKQAKPIFMSKLRPIARYIDMQLARSDITSRERYVLLRDQAWFKLQFFAGDRAGDLSILLSQQISKRFV
ncbi:uncharacterized protein LOC128553283 [Mercenaria mercenaria]|uniref:uncharacterized protein LOC128553283 n=1 Tax=Mercenaria mercenaria TaxID=6596 RepID=UPI00234EC405|nr:uncharacterized protein LOC128553283 [Mercenaria mercenaria]